MVSIQTKQGQKRYIQDVYYALGLKHNLISVGQLTQKGYDIILKANYCFIYNKPPIKMLIARVKMTKNRMYPLSMNYDRKDVSLAQKATCSKDFWLWHLRFGHLHFGGLKLLQQKIWLKVFLPFKIQLVHVRVTFWKRHHWS